MLKKIEGIFVLASASVGSWVSYSYIHSTRKRPLHELVSPAADLLHPLAAPQPRRGDCARSITTWDPASSRPAPARRPPSAAPVSPRPSLLSYFATRHLGRRRAPPGHQVFPPLGIMPTNFNCFAKIIGCTCVHPCPLLGPPLECRT